MDWSGQVGKPEGTKTGSGDEGSVPLVKEEGQCPGNVYNKVEGLPRKGGVVEGGKRTESNLQGRSLSGKYYWKTSRKVSWVVGRK